MNVQVDYQSVEGQYRFEPPFESIHVSSLCILASTAGWLLPLGRISKTREGCTGPTHHLRHPFRLLSSSGVSLALARAPPLRRNRTRSASVTPTMRSRPPVELEAASEAAFALATVTAPAFVPAPAQMRTQRPS